ncbi:MULTISPECIES: sugar ABC transporter permease [unclassified Micromonospora]|uniref:carbohydrate ABC transporter permease n=1 Tax=unclassified Micromonospora TaxID=2617518 RepID=UPI0020B424EA|nr:MULTISPECIES: sugar ABC transporter permease [unclassified Micromonospora]MDM4781387.1 sugar ABC transporter permease [Micromonospora sp. b486]
MTTDVSLRRAARHRPATPPPAARRRTLADMLDRRTTPYLFIAPFFVLFGAFGLFPLLATFWMSLHDWHLINGDGGWTGVQNYRTLLADGDFWNALFNTLSLFVISTVPQLLLALGLAAALNTTLRARTFWRAGVLVPNIVSVVAVALVFAQVFGKDAGIANWLLGFVGVDPINWQAEKWSAHLGISVIVIWRWTGYNALIYLAAMQAVPADLYESARLDGASAWSAFWHVTVPMIRPTILFTTVVSTIGGLQLFAEPLLFDGQGEPNGGSDRQFQTVTMYLYEKGFTLFDAGSASAVAWLLFLLIAVFALVNFLAVRRSVASR